MERTSTVGEGCAHDSIVERGGPELGVLSDIHIQDSRSPLDLYEWSTNAVREKGWDRFTYPY